MGVVMLILPQEVARRRSIGRLLAGHRRRRLRSVKPLRTDDVLVVVLLARPPHRCRRRRRRRHRGLNLQRRSRPPDLAAGHAHPRREVKLVSDAGAVQKVLSSFAPGSLINDFVRFHGAKNLS